MELISPTDSMFLLAESREHPMHVGGLQLFEPPEGAGPDFVREIYESLITREDKVQNVVNTESTGAGIRVNVVAPGSSLSFIVAR